MSDQCIFCEILAGRIPSNIVYQNESVTAIMDIMPVNPGHVLLITNEHFTNALDANPDVMAEVGKMITPLANAVKLGMNAEGIGLHQLNGAAAGQTVFHYHMHFIPQNTGESFDMHGRTLGDFEEIAANCEVIKLVLNKAEAI